MNLGEKIKFYRKREGMTQEELGKKLGVKLAAVSKWECGLVENIPASRLRMMADLFGVTPASLIDDDAAPSEAVALLQQLRDEDRALLAVARNMTPEEVTVMTEFAKKMKGIK